MLLSAASDQFLISTGRSMNQSTNPSEKITKTRIYIMALDSIVNVNSLFTLAVFVGLAWNFKDPSYTLIGITDPCAASSAMVEDFVKYHVYSFSSFLFSSLIALGLKQGISGRAKEGNFGVELHAVAHVNLRVLQAGILASAIGSVSGCVFLMLALIDLVQIKLGRLDCREWYTVAAVGPLVTLVPSALVIFIYFVFHAFTR